MVWVIGRLEDQSIGSRGQMWSRDGSLGLIFSTSEWLFVTNGLQSIYQIPSLKLDTFWLSTQVFEFETSTVFVSARWHHPGTVPSSDEPNSSCVCLANMWSLATMTWYMLTSLKCNVLLEAFVVLLFSNSMVTLVLIERVESSSEGGGSRFLFSSKTKPCRARFFHTKKE